jgi:hypothetical protein
MAMSLENEVFALRGNESCRLFEEKPDSGRFIAVMARSVEMPPGPRSAVRDSDGAPVEQATIVAAEWIDKRQCWIWSRLAQPTKEFIGDMLFDSSAVIDRWYYLLITDLSVGEALTQSDPALSD